ncbi:hypothetical protein CRUP_013009 [Coryphaenoides rupestris]|nr:hypothetical protein CRUP_013009 [Coryphaenoides rupestris]
MGCRLPKLRRAEERQSPGKIYSTLRRPQVETKVGVAYTYHFLDFLLGKEEVAVSSVLCLSSVRELPVQVRELYAQGFVLVAVHPFVHPCGPRHARVQRQLHRAVLLRETPQSSLWDRTSTWTEPRLADTSSFILPARSSTPLGDVGTTDCIISPSPEGQRSAGKAMERGGA